MRTLNATLKIPYQIGNYYSQNQGCGLSLKGVILKSFHIFQIEICSKSYYQFYWYLIKMSNKFYEDEIDWFGGQRRWSYTQWEPLFPSHAELSNLSSMLGPLWGYKLLVYPIIEVSLSPILDCACAKPLKQSSTKSSQIAEKKSWKMVLNAHIKWGISGSKSSLSREDAIPAWCCDPPSKKVKESFTSFPSSSSNLLGPNRGGPNLAWELSLNRGLGSCFWLPQGWQASPWLPFSGSRPQLLVTCHTLSGRWQHFNGKATDPQAVVMTSKFNR